MKEQELRLHSLALAGDRAAFEELVSNVMPKMRAVIWRLIGHPEDIEDILQESLTKAWQNLSSFRGASSFSTWACSIAARASIDNLRAQKKWRTESQIAYANLCATSQEMQGELMAPMMEPEFTFDVREHIAYCLICVGRSLDPDEQAALVLCDVMEFSAREASDAMGVGNSVLRHTLSAARSAMDQRYNGLCALVSKTGICHQCAGLAEAAKAAGGKATPLPSMETLADRISVARSVKHAQRKTQGLHDIFFRNCKKIESERLGSIVPGDCK